jgi:hypothetical protein
MDCTHSISGNFLICSTGAHETTRMDGRPMTAGASARLSTPSSLRTGMAVMRRLPMTDEEQILLRGLAGRVSALRAQVEVRANLGEVRRLRASTTAALATMKSDLGTIRRDTMTLSARGRAGR